MKKYKSAKITGIIFAVLIFSLVVNILYLGATGKHLISKENIASFAKNRSKKEVVEYAQRGQIYTSDHEKVAVNVKKYKIILVLSSQRTGYGKNLAYVKDVNKTASQLGPILGIDVNELTSKLQTAKDEGRYQIELGTKGNNLSASVKKQIEDCNLTGIEFVESNSRYYPLGDFCSYVVDGETGYLCAPTDADAFAEKIKLLSDREVRSSMQKACVEKAEEFRLEISHQQMTDIYKNLLSGQEKSK